jgi:hypothetical protein
MQWAKLSYQVIIKVLAALIANCQLQTANCQLQTANFSFPKGLS